MPAVREVAHECGDYADPDRCTNAATIYKCAKAGCEKRGMNVHDFV